MFTKDYLPKVAKAPNEPVKGEVVARYPKLNAFVASGGAPDQYFPKRYGVSAQMVSSSIGVDRRLETLRKTELFHAHLPDASTANSKRVEVVKGYADTLRQEFFSERRPLAARTIGMDALMYQTIYVKKDRYLDDWYTGIFPWAHEIDLMERAYRQAYPAHNGDPWRYLDDLS